MRPRPPGLGVLSARRRARWHTVRGDDPVSWAGRHGAPGVGPATDTRASELSPVTKPVVVALAKTEPVIVVLMSSVFVKATFEASVPLLVMMAV